MNPKLHNVALEALSKGIYKKNIQYIFQPNASLEEYELVRRLGAAPAASSWVIQQAYRKIGVQMQVSKNVTDDLLASDFSEVASLDNVPWPSPVVEMYFEDPFLPTILTMKATPDQVTALFPDLGLEFLAPEYVTALMQEGSDIETGKLLSLQLRPEMYDSFLASGEVQSMEMGLLSSALSEEDNCTMSFMLHLSLKVMAFASIPIYKPRPLSRKQMHFGGKPHVKGRPQRPSFHVAYMPKVIYPQRPHEHIERHRAFKGKRGHLHWYHSEKFINRQGSWDFYAPVADPITGKFPERNLIKVRKP